METLGDILVTKTSKKRVKNFLCVNCDYKCCRKYNLDRHILTAKHSQVTQVTQNEQNEQNKNVTAYSCEFCGQNYESRNGLWKHKKKCPNEAKCSPEGEVNVLTKLVLELVKSNGDLQKQMLDVCKKTTTTSNSNNNITNSNNKTFNLQLFLNETCKDAMNIMDFVDSIKFQLSDLESVGELGYVSGLSKIIIRNLKALDEHLRPVHCSDLKREKIYVKDADKWAKEGADNKILKNAIKYIAHKNVKMIPAFREKYPDCIYSDSRKSDQYNRLIIEAMGGDGNDEDIKANKIIKKIAKEVLIEK
jgi:hypothetical protein